MKQAQTIITATAPCQGLREITAEVADWVAAQDIRSGLLTAFIRHTSASLVIQENWDSDVQRDIEAFFGDIVPEDPSRYRHNSEGPDDMPAHIKGAMTDVQITIPVADGALLLGQYQGLFLFEHRRRPRPRQIVLHLMGD
jgi:secondary thiamine-phosphate synthase enzyme